MKQRTCFVICPIGDHASATRYDADLLHDFILEPVLSAPPFSMSISRADKLGEPGIITNQIIQAIETADLVVADLSMGNPNVFYEVAVRHMTRMPFIHLIRRGERIPFDNAPVRAIEFDLLDLRSVDSAKKELADQATSAFEKGTSESPVSIAVTMEALRQSGNVEKIAFADLLAEVAAMRASIERIQATASGMDKNPQTLGLGMFGRPSGSSSAKGLTLADLATFSSKDAPTANSLGRLGDLLNAAPTEMPD